jgi:hypothetical protein
VPVEDGIEDETDRTHDAIPLADPAVFSGNAWSRRTR